MSQLFTFTNERHYWARIVRIGVETMARSSDGMFRLRQPSTDLPFTGERLTRELHGQVELEHLHRYCFARDLCAGRDVLDVASGLSLIHI